MGIVTARHAAANSAWSRRPRKPALDVLTAEYHRQFIDVTRTQRVLRPGALLHDRPLAEAVREIGLFGNQNTICRPTDAQVALDGRTASRSGRPRPGTAAGGVLER